MRWNHASARATRDGEAGDFFCGSIPICLLLPEMSTLKSTLESLASQFAMSILNALRSASIEEVMSVTGARAPAAAASASASAPAAPAKRGPGRPKKAVAAAAPAAAAPAPAAAPKRGRPAGSSNNSGNKAKAAAAPKAVAAPKAKKTATGRLARRSIEDIGSVVESIVALLQSHPDGLRAEQIRGALGLEAKELPRPLADGVAAGTLTKTGQKRATTYFLAGGKSKKRGR